MPGWGQACAALWRTWGEKLGLITSDKIDGALYKADALEELADAMNASGIADPRHAQDEPGKDCCRVQCCCRGGHGCRFAGCSRDDGVRFHRDPAGLPMCNVVFVNFGGVEIDTKARVLDTQHQPIAGLYATSPCAGGMMHEYCCGPIAHAGATGRWAGNSAAEVLGIAL